MTAPVVVVGSSTGGADVVRGLLSDIPADYRLLVVQHMLESFTSKFAERLDAVSEYDVRESQREDTVGVGDCLVAKGDCHMVVKEDDGDRLTVELSKASKTNGLRPSVDVTMESVAENAKGHIVGVLLSGMGSDGVEGMRRIREAGGTTVAQDGESSRVFGMPRRAIEGGHVQKETTAEEIASVVSDAVRG